MRTTLVTAVALAVLTAACGGTTPAASAPADSAPAATATPAAAGPQTITIHESEFKFEPAAITLKPGDYVFQFMDDGKFPHDFHIAPQGTTTELAAITKPMKPGESDTLKVTLAKGVYIFWCNVGQHRKAGMEGSITVV